MALAAAAAAAMPVATFVCTPIRVWDGDGPIWCAEGPRVRLRGIAAREIDGRCRRGQPCPRASGVAARDALVRLLGGARGRSREGHVLVRSVRLSCRKASADDYGRVVAACRLPDGRDLACEQVRARVAVRWKRYGGDGVCRF